MAPLESLNVRTATCKFPKTRIGSMRMPKSRSLGPRKIAHNPRVYFPASGSTLSSIRWTCHPSIFCSPSLVTPKLSLLFSTGARSCSSHCDGLSTPKFTGRWVSNRNRALISRNRHFVVHTIHRLLNCALE